MTEPKEQEKCFIIMPITTPDHLVGRYRDDTDHFSHVLECLFVPALKSAGFEPVPPKSVGSNVIQADIIERLATCELVLCDMSILNPNVFFEFGIRTALNKPVALVVDDKTENIPFDTGIINNHKYSSSLEPWSIEKEKEDLSKHVRNAYQKTKDNNALWKYFGVAQTGVFNPEEASLEDKIDLLIQEFSALKSKQTELGRLIAPHGIIERSSRFREYKPLYKVLQEKESDRFPTYQELMEMLNSIKNKAQEQDLEKDK